MHCTRLACQCDILQCSTPKADGSAAQLVRPQLVRDRGDKAAVPSFWSGSTKISKATAAVCNMGFSSCYAAVQKLQYTTYVRMLQHMPKLPVRVTSAAPTSWHTAGCSGSHLLMLGLG